MLILYKLKYRQVLLGEASSDVGTTTVIQSTTSGDGNAGQVQIRAENSITISDVAQITSSALDGSTGNAGQVGLTTELIGAGTDDFITIQTGSEISSR